MECRAMGNTSTKPTTNPDTCPLSAFEGVTWGKLPKEGQRRIFDAYKSYFDTLDPRKRAIGYCVIMGGIPTRKIWTLGAMLCRDNGGRRLFGVTVEGRMGQVDDIRLIKAIYDYVKSEPRFAEIWETLPAGGQATAPLFVALVNGKHEGLRDCVTFMSNASKAINFCAKAIRSNRMAECPIHALPWKTDDPRFEALFRTLNGEPGGLRKVLMETKNPDEFFGFFSICAGLWKIDACQYDEFALT